MFRGGLPAVAGRADAVLPVLAGPTTSAGMISATS
jgi:hypothetical protein